MAEIEHTPPATVQYHTRFDLSQRIEHGIFLVSFSILGLTGLIQKFAESPLSQALIRLLGGIESVRTIHHISAVVLLAVSIFHIISVMYRIMVLRVSWSMLPVFEDFKHLYHDVMYYFGMRKHKAYYGRYNYAEKAEYLAVVWGTIVMAITGFLMWNPIASTRFLPGEFIPAAKAAHGGEAVLAVLAIIIWHFYHVHVRHFNKSMFTGVISEEEMAHEHPAELAQIKSGQATQMPAEEVLRRRKQIYYPVASLVALALGAALVWFITLETTAITTLPPAEVAAVFVPATPTPRPTPMDTEEAPTAEAGIPANTWEGGYSALFRNRCSTCHGVTKVGGLSLATYASALAGGKSGPGIVPGEADRSMVVTIQSGGSHPGQLTEEELQQVIAWINAGAPEK